MYVIICRSYLLPDNWEVANQRDMLEKYCERQGWEVVAVYQDDGFTGLNMERSEFRRMLRAIERRQINLVITKDLSPLGRNYLQTGHLIEDFFPRNGVRYIAMNDGIDTLSLIHISMTECLKCVCLSSLQARTSERKRHKPSSMD